MSVFFSPRESDNNIEIGTYQEFPKAEPVYAATEETPKPKSPHLSVVLVSFGLLCVLQGILNISLRLADKGETEEKSCPQGWITFGSSCDISPNRKSWIESQKDCLQSDADLVIINSRQRTSLLDSPWQHGLA